MSGHKNITIDVPHAPICLYVFKGMRVDLDTRIRLYKGDVKKKHPLTACGNFNHFTSKGVFVIFWP